MNTKHIHHMRRMGLTLATLAASCIWTSSQAANAINVSGSMALSYQLTDLTPRDYYSASVTFDPKGWTAVGASLSAGKYAGDTYAGGSGSGTFVNGSVFNSPDLSLSAPGINALASKAGTTVSAQTTFSTGEAQASLLDGTYAAGPTLFKADRLASVYASSTGSAREDTFTLAPHTSITFTGQFVADASVDPASFLGSAAFDRASAANASIDLLGTSTASFAITFPQGAMPDPLDGATSTSAQLDLHGLLDAQGNATVLGLPSNSTLLTLTVTNNSDLAVQRALVWSIQSAATLKVISSVPEASTLVLEALGLLGLLAVARKRQGSAALQA